MVATSLHWPQCRLVLAGHRRLSRDGRSVDRHGRHPLLTLGWYLIGLVSAKVPAKYIIPQAEKAHMARLARKAKAAQQESV